MCFSKFKESKFQPIIQGLKSSMNILNKIIRIRMTEENIGVSVTKMYTSVVYRLW